MNKKSAINLTKQPEVELKVGDVVFMNSGGQPMTVASINSKTRTCFCRWHTPYGTPRQGSYFMSNVRKA